MSSESAKSVTVRRVWAGLAWLGFAVFLVVAFTTLIGLAGLNDPVFPLVRP